jgi:hypothetical protein
MIYGLQDDLFYVEYTSCSAPIGNMRQEMEKACARLASQGKVMISLSSGLDSQVLLHTFHTMGLPYECAFLYFPGYNERELTNIRILEKKYGFECIIISIDPNIYQQEVEQEALLTGIPPEHHLMKRFLMQLPDDRDLLQGIDSFDFVFRNGKVYCIESWNSIEVASQRALLQVPRSGKIVSVDRMAENNDFALAMLTDDIVSAYISSIEYFKGNGLVLQKDTFWEQAANSSPKLVFSWEYYVKPLLFGKYWGNELEYFPKDVSPEHINYIMKPDNPLLKHNYLKHCVFIERQELIEHLSDWGSNKTKRYTQKGPGDES